MKQYATGRITEHLEALGNLGYPCYLLRGREKSLMVEAAINLMGPRILSQVDEALGGRDRLDYLFLTHSHYDHLGAANYLQRHMPGLALGAHERVATLLLKDSVRALMNRLSEVQLPGFPDIEDYETVAIRPTEIACLLKEGDELDLGGLTVRVHEVPGHTRDSLAYWIPELRMLFPGEAAGVPQGPEGNDCQVCFLTSYDDYLRSLEMIIGLAPKILCIGHAWVLTEEDAARYLAATHAETFEYRRLIERYLHEANGDADKAIENMARREYDEKGTIYQERNAYVTNLTAQVKHIASLGYDELRIRGRDQMS